MVAGEFSASTAEAAACASTGAANTTAATAQSTQYVNMVALSCSAKIALEQVLSANMGEEKIAARNAGAAHLRRTAAHTSSHWMDPYLNTLYTINHFVHGIRFTHTMSCFCTYFLFYTQSLVLHRISCFCEDYLVFILNLLFPYVFFVGLHTQPIHLRISERVLCDSSRAPSASRTHSICITALI
jgi:hypothetical protein